jgi:hypothetical protein
MKTPLKALKEVMTMGKDYSTIDYSTIGSHHLSSDGIIIIMRKGMTWMKVSLIDE